MVPVFHIYSCSALPVARLAKKSKRLALERKIKWDGSYAGESLPVITALKSMGLSNCCFGKSNNSQPLNNAVKQGLLKAPLCLIVGSEIKGVYAETLSCMRSCFRPANARIQGIAQCGGSFRNCIIRHSGCTHLTTYDFNVMSNFMPIISKVCSLSY